MTSTLDAVADPEGVLVVWEGGEDVLLLEDADRASARFERCAPEVDALRRKLALHHPRWLVVGRGVDESAAVAVFRGIRGDVLHEPAQVLARDSVVLLESGRPPGKSIRILALDAGHAHQRFEKAIVEKSDFVQIGHGEGFRQRLGRQDLLFAESDRLTEVQKQLLMALAAQAAALFAQQLEDVSAYFVVRTFDVKLRHQPEVHS